MYRVTQELIERGERDCCEACPVALAVLERWKDVEGLEVEVHYYTTEFRLGGEGMLVRNPAEVSIAIDEFDEGNTISPFEFEYDDHEFVRNFLEWESIDGE